MTFVGLIAILIWILYEVFVPSVLKKQQADVIKSSGESVYSDMSNISVFRNGIISALSNALCSLGCRRRSPVQDDIEKLGEMASEPEESLSQEQNPPSRLKAKFQNRVKSIGMLNTALNALIPAGHQNKRNYHREPLLPRTQPHAGAIVPTVPGTQFILPSEPASAIELARYGTIRDVAYSENGELLAITW